MCQNIKDMCWGKCHCLSVRLSISRLPNNLEVSRMRGDGDNSCLKRRRSIVKSLAAPGEWGEGHRQAGFHVFKTQTESSQRLLIKTATKLKLKLNKLEFPKVLGRKGNRDTTRRWGWWGGGVAGAGAGKAWSQLQTRGWGGSHPSLHQGPLWNHSLDTRFPGAKECDRDRHPVSQGEPQQFYLHKVHERYLKKNTHPRQQWHLFLMKLYYSKPSLAKNAQRFHILSYQAMFRDASGFLIGNTHGENPFPPPLATSPAPRAPADSTS